jgi:hypothetical protein
MGSSIMLLLCNNQKIISLKSKPIELVKKAIHGLLEIPTIQMKMKVKDTWIVRVTGIYSISRYNGTVIILAMINRKEKTAMNKRSLRVGWSLVSILFNIELFVSPSGTAFICSNSPEGSFSVKLG